MVFGVTRIKGQGKEQWNERHKLTAIEMSPVNQQLDEELQSDQYNKAMQVILRKPKTTEM